MKNIVNFINTKGNVITFFLVIFIFLKTCTTNTKIEKTEKRIDNKLVEIDSTVERINSKTITTNEMVEIIKETPFWKSLELEELSDKNRVPINQLKNEYEKED